MTTVSAGAMVSQRSYWHAQLDPRSWHNPGISLINRLIVVAILVASALAIAETEPELVRGNWQSFEVANFAFGGLFLLEYAARLWTAAENDPAHPWAARLRFAGSFTAILDLITALASFVTIVGINIAPFRLIRVLRIIRLARFGPFAAALHFVFEMLKSRRYELAVTFGIAMTILLLGSMMMYWIEGPVQPEHFGSIPRAMWWGITTMTTIGQEANYPITIGGKIAGSIMGLAGVAVITLPTGILAGAFSDAHAALHKPAALPVEEQEEQARR